MPRLLAGNSLGVEAIWQHKAPSVWSRRIANLPLLTCRHGQIPAPDGSSSAQCFAQPSLPPMCRSGAPFSGDINEPCHAQASCSLAPSGRRLLRYFSVLAEDRTATVADNGSVDKSLLIAPPKRWVTYLWCYCLACAAIPAGGVIAGLLHGAPVALVGLCPLVALVVLPIRAGRLGAYTDHDSLTVRNWLTTQSFNRRFIRGFRIGGSIMGGRPNAIQVITADGSSLPISGSISPWYLVSKVQQAQWLAGLKSWLSDGRTFHGSIAESDGEHVK
jgi:hypothetical protein